MKNKDFIDFVINHKNIDKNANLLVCSKKYKGSIFKIAQDDKLKEIKLIYSDNEELIYGIALDEMKYLIKHLKEFKEDYKEDKHFNNAVLKDIVSFIVKYHIFSIYMVILYSIIIAHITTKKAMINI